jgi:hypothetical protein
MFGMGNGPRSVPAKLLALLDAYAHEHAAQGQHGPLS